MQATIKCYVSYMNETWSNQHTVVEDKKSSQTVFLEVQKACGNHYK